LKSEIDLKKQISQFLQRAIMQKPFDRRSMLQVLAGGILASRLSSAAANPLEGAPVSCSIVFHENATLDAQPFGVLHYYLESSTGELKSLIVGCLELKVGQTPHAPHTHPEEELMIFIEGHGEISLDGKVTTAGPGTVVFAAGGCRHGLVNTGPVPLTVYYLKWLGK
jgi:mannose-6-phosphate isomerase-like protein (cupin superfamily)